MSSKYSHTAVNKKKLITWGDIAGYVYVIALILLFLGPFIYGAINDRAPRNAYLKEIQVNDGKVVERTGEYVGTGKNNYYIRVALTQPYNTVVPTDATWVQVDETFYTSHDVGSEAGVLLGNYDVYKEKFWGLFGQAGQILEKSTWGIERVYPSHNEAHSANPEKKYSGKAVVEEKIIKDNGDRYMVLKAEGRSASIMVDQEIYEKSQIGQEIDCDFEAIGEFVKITGVSK